MELFRLGDSLTTYSSRLITSWRKFVRNFNLESSSFSDIVNNSENDDYSFITTDFGYITYFKIDGNAIPVSADTDWKTKERFRIIMTDFIRNGHKIIDTYCLYNDNVSNQIKMKQSSRTITAHKLGIDIDNKDSALRSMLKKNFFESRIVGIYTPDSKHLYSDSLEQAESSLPSIPLSEDAKLSLSQGRGDTLLQAHMAAVSAYESFLFHDDTNYVAKKLVWKEAIIEMAKISDPKNSFSFEQMNPDLLNVSSTNANSDLAFDQYDQYFGKDFNDILHPEIPEKFKNDITKVGDRLYSFLVVESHPSSPEPFSELQKELTAFEFPYRVKTVIGGNVIDHFAQAYAVSRQVVSSRYYSWGAEGQNQYRSAYENLSHYNQTDVSTMTQCVFTTWVDGEENEALLRKNIRSLKNAIQAWTRSETIKVRIDSYTCLESYFSTLPSYHQSTAPKLPIPLRDSLSRMPFIRPTLPKGREGELIITYPDGKIDYLDMSVLAAKITFTCGGSGRGKSVAHMKQRDCSIFAKGNSQLPFEYGIEIGSSTKSSTDSVKAQVKHPDQVEFYNIQNSEFSNSLYINILSTPIGMRQPFPHVFEAIISLLKDRIIGVDGNEMPRADILLKDAVSKTYKRFRQRSHAKKIDLKTIPGLYTILKDLDFFSYALEEESSDDSLYDETSPIYVGWDIVDFLIAHNEINWASKVQSRCEILIEDVLEVARSKDFQESYNEKMNGLVVGRAFLSSLDGFILKYPFVCQPSTTNVYSKHLVTFELGGVIQKGTSPGIYYENRFWFGLASLFTRASIFSSIDDHREILLSLISNDDSERIYSALLKNSSNKSIADGVREYLLNRLTLISTSSKKFHIDELQAFIPHGDYGDRNADYAGGMISSLAFEARKFHIELACSSQRPEHGRYLSNSATMFVILGFPSDADIAACVDLFGVTEDESLRYIKNLQLNPKKGVNAFVCLREVKGYKTTRFRQEIFIPIPGYEIWEYANSGEERHVRSKIQERFTYNDSMLILTGALPNAGYSPEFDQVSNELKSNGDFDDDSINKNEDAMSELIAEKIATKLIKNAPMYIQMGKERIVA